MKKVGQWSVMVVLVLGLVLPPGQGAVQAEEDSERPDLMLLENVPEADVSVKDGTFDLTALHVYGDGSFKKVEEGLSWAASNKKVVKVNEEGQLTFTGKPGRSWVAVSNGRDKDWIFVYVKGGKKQADIHIQKNRGEKYDLIQHAMDEMSMEEKVGQMLMPDFRNWDGRNVTKMLPEIEDLVKEYHLGGVILFRENVVTTEQTTELVADYQNAAEKYGLLVTIDQEGGIVTRLQSGTDFPGNMALGATRSEELSRDVGRAIGEELSALGINMNLAPDMDVNNNPDNPVIGVRSFGENPELVADMGQAYMAGLQETGVAATAKHFPGHGDTAVDSHIGLPEVPHDKERLKEVELYPFQQAMDAGIDAVMTAHVTFPEIDDTKVISKKDGEEIALPATLSKKVLTGLMREEMGYEGLVITDALNMNAIQEHFGSVDAVIRAINAGTDIVLMPVGLEEVAGGIYEAVGTGEIEMKTIEDSVERILTMKIRRGIIKSEQPPSLEDQVANAKEVVGSEEHKQVEKEAAEKSITLVKNDQILPIQPEQDDQIVVVGDSFSSSLAEAVKDLHEQTTLIDHNSQAFTSEQQTALQEADYIIAGTYTYNVWTRSPDHPQMKRMKEILEMAEGKVIGVGIRNPYDVMAYPEVDAYIAQYGFRKASFTAAASTIFGQNQPSGKLPVTIPGENGVLYEYGTGLSY
ncbi:glycoside hydrolase family 3 protein [Halobacillus litoralis]|uniref:glycoside hydrolase family 3 protein n=1 Tax=Halobacillus litoralis TaxID=45668 RepID=UPI00136C1542|nr:glycoside hydrolase family 3 protein [Halobacillus litoralis]MYL38159.1 beta-N-acetylhexosaminidase [Halobacillus litoralis]